MTPPVASPRITLTALNPSRVTELFGGEVQMIKIDDITKKTHVFDAFYEVRGQGASIPLDGDNLSDIIDNTITTWNGLDNAAKQEPRGIFGLSQDSAFSYGYSKAIITGKLYAHDYQGNLTDVAMPVTITIIAEYRP